MASRNDGDVQDKGRRLWNALKNKKIGRVERKSIIQELLKNGAPVNFREPDKQVRNFINDVSVVIICRGITPHYYLPKKNKRVQGNLIQRTDHLGQSPTQSFHRVT